MTATIGRQATLTSWTSPLVVAQLTSTSVSITDTSGAESLLGIGEGVNSFTPTLRGATASIAARWKGGSVPQSGAGGKVEVDPAYYGTGSGNPIAGFTQYSLNLSWPAIEISGGSDASFDRTYLADALTWGGSIDLRLDDTLTLTKAQLAGSTAIDASFIMDGNHSFDGDIWITGTTKTASVGSASAQTFTFQGTGALTAVGASNFYAAGAIGVPTAGELVVTYASGRIVRGDAFPTAVNMSVVRDGLILLDIAAQYTGALTIP